MNRVHILQQYVDAGGCVLIQSLEGAPQDVLEGLIVIGENNCHSVILGIYQGRARGFFHDPSNLLDSAALDKFAVVGSFLSIMG